MVTETTAEAGLYAEAVESSGIERTSPQERSEKENLALGLDVIKNSKAQTSDSTLKSDLASTTVQNACDSSSSTTSGIRSSTFSQSFQSHCSQSTLPSNMLSAGMPTSTTAPSASEHAEVTPISFLVYHSDPPSSLNYSSRFNNSSVSVVPIGNAAALTRTVQDASPGGSTSPGTQAMISSRPSQPIQLPQTSPDVGLNQQFLGDDENAFFVPLRAPVQVHAPRHEHDRRRAAPLISLPASIDLSVLNVTVFVPSEGLGIFRQWDENGGWQ